MQAATVILANLLADRFDYSDNLSPFAPRSSSHFLADSSESQFSEKIELW